MGASKNLIMGTELNACDPEATGGGKDWEIKMKKYGDKICFVMAVMLGILITGCAQIDKTGTLEGEESAIETATTEDWTQEESLATMESFDDSGDSLPRELSIANPGNDYYCREGQRNACQDGIVLDQVLCQSNSISDPERWFQENELFLPSFRSFFTESLKEHWREQASEQAQWVYESTSGYMPNSFYDDQYFYMVSETDRSVESAGSLSLQLYDLQTRNLTMVLNLDDFSYAEGYEPEPDQEYDFVRQSVFWAQSEGDILYLTIGHSTYAADCPNTGYLLAVDLSSGEVLWKTHEQVANARDFVVLEDAIITGYGFTDEADLLYIIDKGTGIVENCLRLCTAPDYLVKKNGQLYVHTYDTDYVFQIRRQSEYARDTQTAKERLQNLPGTYEELCKTWDVCVFDQNQEIVSYNGMGCLADFLEAVEDGTPENVILAKKTGEGATVLTYISYNGSDFYVMEDTSREKENGDEDSYTEEICSYEQIRERIGEISGMAANRKMTEAQQSQVRAFAQNREEWRFNQEEYGPYRPVYAVYDLDGDGRLELMASVCMGTGVFSENYFYRISEDGKTLENLAQCQLTDAGCEEVPYTDGYDVAYRMIDAYRDSDGRIYYDGGNGLKDGAAFYAYLEGFFYLKEDTIFFQDIRQYIEQLDPETDEFAMTYYDTEGNEITRDTYDELLADFVQGMERHSVYLNWFCEDEVREDTEDGWYQKLAQSYRFALYY